MAEFDLSKFEVAATYRRHPPSVFLVIVCGLFLFAQLITPGTTQNPPKIVAQGLDTRRVVASGSTLQLPCGVEGDPSTFFFEWFKQGHPILAAAGSLGASGTEDRFRVTQGGALKIKSALPEDTGYYTCSAVNGFGTARIGVTLIVLGDEDYDDTDKENPNNNLFPDKEDDIAGKGMPKSKPEFVSISRFSHRVIQRPAGSSIRLKCEGKGHPKPQLTWLRNGLTVYSAPGMMEPQQPTMGQLPLGAKKGRWSLHLQELRVADSGNYTCLLHNSMGSINNSFTLEVVDQVKQKPELTGDHPVNTTVAKGATATLQCRVRSDIKPHIQWLKRLDKISDPGDENLINVQGEFFRVLKSSEVLENPEGTFLNKLLIADVNEKDSGKYVCLGANTEGYSFRSAYVTVLQAKNPNDDWVSVSLSLSTVPFPITVAVAVLGLVLLVCVSILLRRYIQRRRRRSHHRDQNRDHLGLQRGHLHQCQHGRTYIGLEPSNGDLQISTLKSNRSLKRDVPIGASYKGSKSSGQSNSGTNASRSTSRLHSAACL